MKRDDLESKLRSLKLIHLTERALIAYCDQQLDPVSHALAEAHLKQCFICERQLRQLREEADALSRREISAEDVALVERLMAEDNPERRPPGDRPIQNARGVPVQERLTEYLRPMVASWQTFFKQQAARGAYSPHTTRQLTGQGEQLWEWQSEDGLVRARAMVETPADLTIHFHSSEMTLEGARFRVRLGPVKEQVTFERVSESEVYAKVAVPHQHPRTLAGLSIEAARGDDER